MVSHVLRTTALLNAVELAAKAPSPVPHRAWRWRITGTGLHLHTRANLIGTGAALHYAVVSLTAQGWQTEISRFPDTGVPGHVAIVETEGWQEPTTAAMVLAAAALTRIERGDTGGAPAAASPELVRTVSEAAARYGVSVHLLPEQAPVTETLLALTTTDSERAEAGLATGEAVAAALLAAECGGLRAELLGPGSTAWRARRLLLRAMSTIVGTPRAVLQAVEIIWPGAPGARPPRSAPG